MEKEVFNEENISNPVWLAKKNPHLEKFKTFVESNKNSEQGWVGHSPIEFWNKTTCEGGIKFKELDFKNKLSSETLKRTSLKDIVEDNSIEFVVKIISILAWGRMKAENAVMFFGNYHKYEAELKKSLTSETKDRHEIYDDILKLNLKNCKPAYFTKLIFFFTSKRNKPGYIMDQWTAKSINLITGESIVRLDSMGFVSKNNDSNVYNRFCSYIDELAKHMKISGSLIEEYLFDKGGREIHIGDWRKYVKENHNR